MKKLFLSLACIAMIYFSSLSILDSPAIAQAKSPAVALPDSSLSVISVEGKNFLSLIPEPAPQNMFWGTYGSKVESFYGVVAYSNGAKKTNRKYQCTELIHRFLSKVYGIPSRIGLGLGHAKDLAKNIAKRYRSKVGSSPSLGPYHIQLENFTNKQTVYPPVVGSIVSMHFNRTKTGYGHVAIIRALVKNEDGSLKATLFDQHGLIHKEANIPIQADEILFRKDVNGNWGGQVVSWLHQSNYEVISWTNPVVVGE